MFPLPSPSEFVSDVSGWSVPFFQELWPIASYAIGIILAFGVIAFIVMLVARAFNR